MASYSPACSARYSIFGVEAAAAGPGTHSRTNPETPKNAASARMRFQNAKARMRLNLPTTNAMGRYSSLSPP